MMKTDEELRKGLRCTIHPLNSLQNYKYVVVCSFYQGKYVLSRHKQRTTWETQGGHIENGETPLAAARRELYEESGISEAELHAVCDYYGYDAEGHSNGVVFAAVVHSFSELPQSEMKEVSVFESLPENLTYPYVTPRLFECAKEYGKSLDDR